MISFAIKKSIRYSSDWLTNPVFFRLKASSFGSMFLSKISAQNDKVFRMSWTINKQTEGQTDFLL